MSQFGLGRNKIFPVQRAWTLLIPLRNFTLSPKRLIQRLALDPEHHVLEFGTGPGYFSVGLAQALPRGRLVLADIQSEMLSKAKKRLTKRGLTKVEYSVTQGEKLDFADESFNRIVLVAVLGEVQDQQSLMKEFARLLRDGGLLSISELAGDADKLSIEELETLGRHAGLVVKEVVGKRGSYTVNFGKR